MRLLAILAAGLLLFACGEDPGMAPPDTRDEQPEAPADDGSAEDEEVIEGTLGGDAQLEGGCAWLDTADGRFEVMYPQGYGVAFDPVRLLGPDGDTIAGEGDAVRVRGRVAGDLMSICQVGTIFQATEVLVPT